MIGPRNSPPKSCRHGHLDAFRLKCNSREGWRWRCAQCANHGRVPIGSAKARAAARREDILDMREFGFTEREIAQKFNVKLESHQRWCYRHGLEVK